jgi:hypothetical protein
MNRRRVAVFVDDMLSDRRPRRFKAGPVDADVLRVAIAMRAARPGEGVPEEGFVARLRQEMAVEAGGAATSAARPVVTRRARLMVGAAAIVTMTGGTVAATTTLNHALAASSGHHATQGQLLRVGTFESPDGHAVGKIVAYRGDPSWVFMSIHVPGVNGTIGCQIQMDSGRMAAAGSFEVYNGVGQWARTVPVDVGRFRGATLETGAGTAVATATFRGI